MKSILKSTGLLLLLQSPNKVEGSLISSFPSLDLISTSLVMLEAAIPAPHTLVDLQERRNKDQQKDLVLVDNKVDESVIAQVEGQSQGQTEMEQSRLRQLRKNKKTTLTIVQDFPKKQSDQLSSTNMNLVQNHANDVKIDGQTDDQNNTLTIVQEFPKKNKHDNIAGNIEMVQGQEQNTNVHYFNKKKNAKTTLTIVQDFPKKKTDSQGVNSVEMVQGKNTPGDIKIVDESKSTQAGQIQDGKKESKSTDGPVTQKLVEQAITTQKK